MVKLVTTVTTNGTKKWWPVEGHICFNAQGNGSIFSPCLEDPKKPDQTHDWKPDHLKGFQTEEIYQKFWKQKVSQSAFLMWNTTNSRIKKLPQGRSPNPWHLSSFFLEVHKAPRLGTFTVWKPTKQKKRENQRRVHLKITCFEKENHRNQTFMTSGSKC